jgi:hypothetical protein
MLANSPGLLKSTTGIPSPDTHSFKSRHDYDGVVRHCKQEIRPQKIHSANLELRHGSVFLMLDFSGGRPRPESLLLAANMDTAADNVPSGRFSAQCNRASGENFVEPRTGAHG